MKRALKSLAIAKRAMIAAALILALLFTAFYLLLQRHETKQAILANESTARVLTAQFNTIIHDIEANLNVIADVIKVQGLEKPVIASFIDQASALYLDSVRLDAGLSFFNADGEFLQGKNHPDDPLKKPSISERAYFQACKNGHVDTVYVSGPLMGVVVPRPVVVFSRCLYDQQNKLLGAVTIPISIKTIESYLASLAKDGVSIVFKRTDGTFIASFPHVPEGVAAYQSPELIDKLKQSPNERSFSLKLTNVRGEQIWATYSRLDNDLLTIGTAISHRVLLAKTENLLLILVYVLSVLLLYGYYRFKSATRRTMFVLEDLNYLFEVVPDALITIEPESFLIKDCNAAAERLFGVDRQIIMGKTLADLSPVLQADGQDSVTALTHLRTQLADSSPLVYKWLYKKNNDDTFIADVSLALNSRHNYVLASMRDVTDRELLIEQLQDQQIKLKESNIKLDLANNAKSSFVSTISHELRTPLNSLMGLTQIMIGESPNERQADQLQKMFAAEKSLMALIGDVLDLAKIESGEFQCESQPFSFHQMARDVVDGFAIFAENKGLELRLQILPETPDYIQGDQQRVRQVLINLLGNALKFTEKGSVLVQVARTKLGNSNLGAQQLIVAVKDTGIGIEHDVLKQLFQPFVQADHSTARRFGGTGLGLTISKRLVERMGGKLFAESQPGVGSVFRFTFNAELAPQPVECVESETNQCVPEKSIAGMKVLLVEDTEVSGMVVEQLLKKQGVEVVWVQSGEAAVAAVDRLNFDLVLMDLHMPGMDGHEAARVIRSNRSYDELPIVALTASVSVEDRQQCIESGMNDFLGKPVILGDLVDMLYRWRRIVKD